MFKPENWAIAFVNAAKNTEAAEEALQYLKVFCSAALALPGDLSGRNDADRLGQSIDAAGGKFFTAGTEDTASQGARGSFLLAKHYVQIMLRCCYFQHYKKIIRSIEKILNKQKGIEVITVESAVKYDVDFLEKLAKESLKITAAKEIKIVQRLRPELIGGLRLRWGSMLFDGSIKRSLEKMALHLES